VTQITDHLADIERRIASALEQSGRAPESVMLVAVSKTQSAERVSAAAALGLLHFGENYLQEALGKIATIDNPALSWHFIGGIQANKTRLIAEHFSWVDTLDRARIADRLNAQRPPGLPPLNVLIQLNTDGEPQKGGVSEDELLPLALHVAGLPRLRLRGLLGIPPEGQTLAARRASFLAAGRAADRLRAAGLMLDTLSLGMSGDFELAIACGSTAVRIGTALFGLRGPDPA
jgi:pyridoxal phosphate enzyme (YggS family)